MSDIAGDGWREAAQSRLIVEDKAKKTKTKPDFTLGRKKYTAELISERVWLAHHAHTPSKPGVNACERAYKATHHCKLRNAIKIHAAQILPLKSPRLSAMNTHVQ